MGVPELVFGAVPLQIQGTFFFFFEKQPFPFWVSSQVNTFNSRYNAGNTVRIHILPEGIILLSLVFQLSVHRYTSAPTLSAVRIHYCFLHHWDYSITHVHLLTMGRIQLREGWHRPLPLPPPRRALRFRRAVQVFPHLCVRVLGVPALCLVLSLWDCVPLSELPCFWSRRYAMLK